MTWPIYSEACRRDVDELLKRGGSLSAYKANPKVGAGPSEGSWAWRLERDIEKRFNVRHAVALNSGTAALHAALAGLDLRGGEVVTSPFTFSATASAILLAGGAPVFADVDPYTCCITKETVKHALTKRTKAILPVHLFGGLADIEGLRSFGLPVIEDACQAVGARSGGGFAGTLGHAGCFSFNGAKNVPAGEAGALVTNEIRTAEDARLRMNHAENFGCDYVGYNYRPNELTCCVAWHGLQELEERNEKRRAFAMELKFELHALLNGKADLTLPAIWPDGNMKGHVFYVFPFVLGKHHNRDRFIERLKSKGVSCGGGYITPHLGKYKAFEKYVTHPLPNVTELSEQTLCLLYDVYHEEPEKEAIRVANAMRESL